MKINQIILLAGMVFFMACGPEQPNGSVQSLKEKRDSLKEAKSALSTQITELEEAISALDTTSQRRLTSITVSPVVEGKFEHFFTVQGNVETDKEALVYPQTQERILSISVKEGEKVSKGQTLMVLDSRVLQNSISELKGRLDLAQTIFEKQERLWKKNIGSEIQFLEAKNNRDALKNNLETLNSQLDMYRVKAPFDGIADEIMPKVGEMASPMGPAARVINIAEVYVKCDVTERYLGKIAVGDSVKLNFPALGLSYHSNISRIGQYINPANRTFSITVRVKNKNEKLRPNLIAEVSVRDFSVDSALLIPASMVLLNPEGKEFVYTTSKKDGKAIAKKKIISTGMSYNGMQLVTAGLDPKDFIVGEGSRSIKDGEEVQIVSGVGYDR